MAEQNRFALGIDLGGTSVKAGVVTHKGAIIGRGEVATEASKGVDTVIANMARAAREAMAAAGVTVEQIEGVGFGAPGICDGPRGVVVDAVNIGWKNVPAAELLQKALGVPAFLNNDANCAALGEQWCGAAMGSNHMLMFTIGTGVGGGLVLDGNIYQGFRGWGGEFGHMPAVENGPQCNCGRRGCLETVASATAMAAVAKREIEAGRAPLLAQRAATGEKVDARLVITAAKDGDGPARAILAEVGRHLGQAIAQLVSALNPELVVVGGGGAYAGDFLLEPAREVVRTKAMPGPADVCKIIPAELGNDAGLIGAASLVWR
ncbi:MAG TPA: ROK family protein [Symbiobacteriaceae bacterium]|jgi:glucokinase|nr:ROK family protein [Symbiobacteriaceae bacterium]